MKFWLATQCSPSCGQFRVSRGLYSLVGVATIVFIVASTFSGCGSKDRSEEGQGGKLSWEESKPAIVHFSIPPIEPNYWQRLLQLQDSIAHSPTDSLLRKVFCERSYFPQNRAIVVVGIGRLRNPKTGTPIPTGYARQAAFSSAARWAAYTQTWLEQNYQPEFGAISTALNLPSKVVREQVIGDSLLLEVAFEYAGK